MNSIITRLSEKKCIGLNHNMSYADYQAQEIWKRFMPRRNEIKNRVGLDYLSIQVFGNSYWNTFNAENTFQKWAAVEVSVLEDIPAEMDTLIIPAGLYAVFVYKGDGSTAPSFFESIYSSWLPNSVCELADRPHFEILGEKYQKNNPTSEEEVWIPIQFK
jgi:AraC family transcriptional regulator